MAWKAAAWSKDCRCITITTDEGDVAMKCPTEVPITDRREKELADLGFVAAGALQGHRLRCFLQRPVVPKAEAVRHGCGQRQCAPVDADCRTSWPASRFAHYLKAMMRDKIGSFMSRTEAEQFLNRWITQLRGSG